MQVLGKRGFRSVYARTGPQLWTRMRNKLYVGASWREFRNGRWVTVRVPPLRSDWRRRTIKAKKARRFVRMIKAARRIGLRGMKGKYGLLKREIGWRRR